MQSHLSSNNTSPIARQVAANELNLILKSLNTKKTSAVDKIPIKLVKLASNFLSTPLGIAINKALYIFDGCCTEFNIYNLMLYLF